MCGFGGGNGDARQVLDVQGKVRTYKTSIPLLPALEEVNLGAFIGGMPVRQAPLTLCR